MRGTLDRDFGNWLAGFIDGEGCFYMRTGNSGRRHYCCFSLEVRLDEAEIIHEIRNVLGTGQIKHRSRPGPRGNDCPQIAIALQSRRGCLILMGLLDGHPLRAKKRRDYAIWRLALREQCKDNTDQGLMAAYKQQLSAVKRYEEGEAEPLPEALPQLRLIS